MRLIRIFALASLWLSSISAFADNGVVISDNWARATAPGQEVGAAYMTLQSAEDTSLVGVESPAADSVEIHSMSMENGVMKMRSLKSLPLAAGKPAKLAPGGFHLMLFDLKKPLKAGEKVSFKLHFKNAKGEESVSEISSPIKSGASE